MLLQLGLYWFKSGKTCRNYLEKLVKNNIKSKGEFYVAPAYNLLIEDGLKVTFSIVGNDSDVMYGTGTPDDLMNFLDNLKRLKFYLKPNYEKTIFIKPHLADFTGQPIIYKIFNKKPLKKYYYLNKALIKYNCDERISILVDPFLSSIIPKLIFSKLPFWARNFIKI